MEKPTALMPLSPALPPPTQMRTPSRSPTRQRITDDLLSNLSPTTTLEEFTSQSGKLKASIEAATETERAFGIRATIASKKIQEWVDELASWPWPVGGGASGFETSPAKRRKLSGERSEAEYTRTDRERNGKREIEQEEYIGSLSAEDLYRYEIRIDEIAEDMEDLKVEEIKRQVLDSHFSPRSRPSSSASSAPMPTLLAYARMDDLTAVLTATVLQTLPNLSKLLRLMDVWSIRFTVLRKVPRLLSNLEDAEVALKSGWQSIEVPSQHHVHSGLDEFTDQDVLSRESFNVMRDVLQDKVTRLGQELDYMLDTLEGRQDTLPDSWLDRMEDIEKNYGEWVIAADRKVREGEWDRMAKARQEQERRRKEAEEAARKEAEERRSREVEEAKAAEIARLETEQHLGKQEEARIAEAERVVAEQTRLKEETDAEAARKEIEDRRLKEVEDSRAAEAARQHTEEQKLRREKDLLAAQAMKKEIQDAQRRQDPAEAEKRKEPIDAQTDTELPEQERSRQEQSPEPISHDSQHVETSNGETIDAILPKGMATVDSASSSCPTPRSSDHSPIPREPEMLERASFDGGFDDFERKLEVNISNINLSRDITSSNSSPHTPLPLTPSDETSLDHIAPPSCSTPPRSPFNDQWEVLSDVKSQKTFESPNPSELHHANDLSLLSSTADTRSRSTSLISGYSSSDSIPEIQAETFYTYRPVLPPIQSGRTFAVNGEVSVSPDHQARSTTTETDAPLDDTATPSGSPPGPAQKFPTNSSTSGPSSRVGEQIRDINLHDGAQESVLEYLGSVPDDPLERIETPRPTSKASNATAIIRDQIPQSPNLITPSSPMSGYETVPPFFEIDESSPSAGRFGSRNTTFDESPPDSPPFTNTLSHRRLSQTPSDFSESVSEAPLFDNLDVLDSSYMSSPRKTSTDDQIQQQISSILNSIPSDIRLTTEPGLAIDSTPKDTLRPRKVRRSVTPSQRTTSSLASSRSPTPFLTLAPAYNHTGPSRSRPQFSNPEIKLYHLSRSTGEKPIKLFVRLVGEHGERVMVRVGGGWADLGEYLKEYASHHGRRAGINGVGDAVGKVEIQDLPLPSSTSSRQVPSSFTTARRAASPINSIYNSRPASAFFDRERPLSSLAVRKHRLSMGESSSTPIPFTPNANASEKKEGTPDSGGSTSRLSWTDDNTSSTGGALGLAGPKGKQKELEKRDLEWVESMKEKVKMASAEKKEGKTGGGGMDEKAKFGELERVGGTKRLFRKSYGEQREGK